MASFSEILDEELLASLAGDRSFERGQDYFESGAVQSLAEIGDRIVADVEGNDTYQVQLWLREGELASRCTCPMGVDGYFCKHCVAVGLAWIDEPPPYRPDGIVTHSGTTMADMKQYLARQERDVLVTLILDRAMDDTRWRESLLMKAAAAHAGGADIETFRKALRNTIPVRDLVEYSEVDSYVENVQQAIDGLETLMDLGYASDVIELCEEAIAMFNRALNSIDDSNGSVQYVVTQVQELHLRACKVAKPDPVKLAARLLELELDSDFDFFHDALTTYSDVLGDAGWNAYRQLVDAEWRKVPTLRRDRHWSFDLRRIKLNDLKEMLVEETGTLQELVDTIAKDLSSPSRYEKIAALYRDNDNLDEAIAWAERGMEAFQGSNRLHLLGRCLVDLYERQQRYEEATTIVWEWFQDRPSLHEYQQLKQQAELGGTWLQWRDRVISFIRGAYAKPAEFRGYYLGHQGHSLLVSIYLWENDLEAAWKTAQAGGCSKQMWMQLADARAIDFPEDSLSIYKPAIAPLIEQTNNEAYARAVEILEKVRDIMERLNRGAEFNMFAAKLGTEYKRKRNFINLMEERGMY